MPDAPRSLAIWCSSCLLGRPCFVHEPNDYSPPAPAPAGAAEDDAVEALAERICRAVHPTRWEYRAMSHPCDDVCLPAARAVAEHVEQQARAREAKALRKFLDWFASNYAFNGAGDPGQALYDYGVNAELNRAFAVWIRADRGGDRG